MLNFYHFLEKNPLFKQFKVDDLLFTAYDCEIEESKLDYWVDKNYFCYIVRGGVEWKTLDDEYSLIAGDAAFIRRGAHRISKITNSDFCALLIFLPDYFIRSVMTSEQLITNMNKFNQLRVDSIIPLELDQSLIDYFNTVLNYFTQSRPPSKSLLNIKFKELIINIITTSRNPKMTECFREISHDNQRALRPIMQKNFRFDLKLEEFAKLSNRSLATFHRDFLKEFNTTPGKWIKKKRLKYSKFLLETRDSSINEIAFEAGFKNTSHFIKTFKNHYHQTPLKYKQNMYEEKFPQA